jgi:hypothetical protein
MAAIDKTDLKTGFWVGLGLALAFALFTFVTMLLKRTVDRHG